MSALPTPPQREAVPRLSELPSRVGKCSVCGFLYRIHIASERADAVLRAFNAVLEKGCTDCGAKGQYQTVTHNPVDIMELAVREAGGK